MAAYQLFTNANQVLKMKSDRGSPPFESDDDYRGANLDRASLDTSVSTVITITEANIKRRSPRPCSTAVTVKKVPHQYFRILTPAALTMTVQQICTKTMVPGFIKGLGKSWHGRSKNET